jgi:predicted nucleotide-binding protein (sugar kinase/HSP70/actin superfamily)
MDLFWHEWRLIAGTLETARFAALKAQLAESAARLRAIELRRPAQEVPNLLLTGEIFVRRDGLSRQNLTEHLAKKGFAVTCGPVAEWIHYSDYLVKKGLNEQAMSLKEKLRFTIRNKVMAHDERRIKTILSQSGLVHAEPVDMDAIIQAGRRYISPNMTGEAILTVGGALVDVASLACGVIAIGPFGCMPNRVSESILNTAMNRAGKLATDPANVFLRNILTDVEDLPFLAIETDGSPFPQLIQAKLEAFCLQAQRLHAKMQRRSSTKPPKSDTVRAPAVQALSGELAGSKAH